MAQEAGTAITALAASTGLTGIIVRTAGGIVLLDGAGERLVAASGRGRGLATALAGADGALRVGPLTGQIRGLARSLPASGRPRLERLRLGHDRLAPPVTCTCLKADLPDLGTVLVIALPPEPCTASVPPATAPDAAPDEGTPPPTRASAAEEGISTDATAPAPETASHEYEDQGARPEPTRPSLRFLWRSDVEDRLFEASPVLADRVRGGVVGRTWPELLDGSVVDDAGRLAEALATRSTFRAVPARWRIGGGPRSLAVELSATPRRSPDGAFAGFDGFGLIEAAPIPEPEVAPPSEPAAAVSPPPTESFPAFASLAGAAMAGLTEIMTAPFAFGWRAVPVLGGHAAPVEEPPAPRTDRDDAPEWVAADAEPEPPEGADAPIAPQPPVPDDAPMPEDAPMPVEAPAPASGESVPDPLPLEDGQLSLSEHHAFREIARALGARFAGDEPGPEETVAEGASASVTPLRPLSRGAAREDDVAEGVLRAAPDVVGGFDGEDADTRRLLDRLPIGTLVHRGETALYANRAFLETVGYADVPELQQDGGVARLFRGGPSGGRRSTDAAAVGVSTKSGTTVPVEVRITTVPWGSDPAGLMLVRRLPDIDPAQRAEALELELAVARARLREQAAILDAAGGAVVTVDARLRLTALDRRAEALFGYESREVAGEPLALLVAAESHPALHALVEAAKTPTAAPAAGALDGRGRYGAALPLDARLARLPAGPGEASGFCVVFTDAAPARAAERARAAAEDAARAAGDRAAAFLERAGHEVRAPLNTVLGFAELMLEERFGPVGSERYRGYLRDLHAAGTRVVGLVGDLLDLARLEAGRQPMASDTVDLGAVAAACVTLFQAQASRARIVVRTSFAAGLPPVRADANALRQVAANLVANAIQFTEAGGQVIVSTGLADGAVFLRVRDTGIGMTRGEIAAALDPFRPGDAAPAQSGAGNGLGLPLTRALAAANGATIHLQSVKGEGTLAELLVPAERVVRP